MSDESTRAAAERRRKGDYPVGEDGSHARHVDAHILADAFLSGAVLEGADDGEPVTREWWATIAKDGRYWYWPETIQTENFVLAFGEAGNLLVVHRSDETVLFETPTRGDVRRLCAALGIDLPAQPSKETT